MFISNSRQHDPKSQKDLTQTQLSNPSKLKIHLNNIRIESHFCPPLSVICLYQEDEPS